jgi:hypothetical protein
MFHRVFRDVLSKKRIVPRRMKKRKKKITLALFAWNADIHEIMEAESFIICKGMNNMNSKNALWEWSFFVNII